MKNPQKICRDKINFYDLQKWLLSFPQNISFFNDQKIPESILSEINVEKSYLIQTTKDLHTYRSQDKGICSRS